MKKLVLTMVMSLMLGTANAGWNLTTQQCGKIKKLTSPMNTPLIEASHGYMVSALRSAESRCTVTTQGNALRAEYGSSWVSMKGTWTQTHILVASRLCGINEGVYANPFQACIPASK